MCDKKNLTSRLALASGCPPADPGQGSPAAGPIQPDWVARNPGPDWTVPKARGQPAGRRNIETPGASTRFRPENIL